MPLYEDAEATATSTTTESPKSEAEVSLDDQLAAIKKQLEASEKEVCVLTFVTLS